MKSCYQDERHCGGGTSSSTIYKDKRKNAGAIMNKIRSDSSCPLDSLKYLDLESRFIIPVKGATDLPMSQRPPQIQIKLSLSLCVTVCV